MTKAVPLECLDLRKDYGCFQAVKGVSFSLQEGEVFGLLGPNGAGKTSIISMISTLEPITAGQLRIFGDSIEEKPVACKMRMGLVPQEMVTHGFFNVEEILHFHSGFYGIRHNHAWIEVLLDRLALKPHRKKNLRQLSGGMKKRLLIAKALVHKPRLLLLDEPTAGVDIDLRETLWEFVLELKKEGTAVLLTTHHLREAQMLCDRVAVMDHGLIQCMGPLEELIAQLTTRILTIEFSAIPETMLRDSLLEIEGLRATFSMPEEMHFRTFLDNNNIPPHMIQDLSIRYGTLEDAVRRILKGAS